MSTHGHGLPTIALVDREGADLVNVTLPRPASSAAFIDDRRVVVSCFQSDVFVFDLDGGRSIESFDRPGGEIGVAANTSFIALAHNHGHLVLRPHSGGVLPAQSAMRASNQETFTEHMDRNVLRLSKAREAGMKHTLGGQRSV